MTVTTFIILQTAGCHKVIHTRWVWIQSIGNGWSLEKINGKKKKNKIDYEGFIFLIPENWFCWTYYFVNIKVQRSTHNKSMVFANDSNL